MNLFFLHIADFCVQVEAEDAINSLPRNYKPFIESQPVGELLMSLHVGMTPLAEKPGAVIGQFDDLGYKQEVYERKGGGYFFRIFDSQGKIAAEMVSVADFSLNKVWLSGMDGQTRTFGFNNTIMIAFAFASAYKKTLTMHSSVTVKNGWGYMFLGKSGTGKSTHSSLWLKHIEGTHLLNDDNPVLRLIDDEVIVYGSPWSGKTPCYRQEKAKVGALVMLEQKPYNKIAKENVMAALSSMLCSCSIMIWDKPSYDLIMQTISDVISRVGVHHLECLPNRDAAMLSHATLARD